MTAPWQGSLLDLCDAPELGALAGHLERTGLGGGAWLDLRPGWLAGGTDLFDELVARVPWHAERRQMYERVVDVPRLTKFYGER
ncbi:MAG TPA: alpha-ketoglutarate-dependent dioxygenase AlkB, partial [Jatrophihabitans sp.]|nr:alpha-ketoglutarate-dependent dioxygenase AlkB [Jatrophihabitans sp.]